MLTCLSCFARIYVFMCFLQCFVLRSTSIHACARVLCAMFVCLDLGYVCHAMCNYSPSVALDLMVRT